MTPTGMDPLDPWVISLILCLPEGVPYHGVSFKGISNGQLVMRLPDQSIQARYVGSPS
jgi:hypothetical protein